jgi:hypothetical protein
MPQLRLVPGSDGSLRVHWTEVSTDPSLSSGAPTLGGLSVGVAYSASVSARNERGLSLPRDAAPAAAAPPPQKPDRPTNVRLVADSAASLKVSFFAPDSDGGATVTKYKVEWDPAGALGFAAGAKVNALLSRPLAPPAH